MLKQEMLKDFKDGIADALLSGTMATTYSDGYKQGYDFGITIYSRMLEEEKMNDERHGSPRDRGSADAYYGRPFDPHYWSEGTYHGTRTEMKDMTPEEIVSYTKGYNQQQDRKDWGDE